MVEIVTSVAEGKLPRDSGLSMLMSAFRLNKQHAESIMGNTAEGFQ